MKVAVLPENLVVSTHRLHRMDIQWIGGSIW